MKLKLDWGDRPQEADLRVTSIKGRREKPWPGSPNLKLLNPINITFEGDTLHTYGTASVRGNLILTDKHAYALFEEAVRVSNVPEALKRLSKALLKELQR